MFAGYLVIVVYPQLDVVMCNLESYRNSKRECREFQVSLHTEKLYYLYLGVPNCQTVCGLYSDIKGVMSFHVLRNILSQIFSGFPGSGILL